MRLPALAAALGAVALMAGCSTPCQDLGDRLCSCVGSGTALDTCKQQVKNQLSATSVGKNEDNFCAQKLNSCQVPTTPPDVRFCEWILTEDGKVACGLAFPPPAAGLVDAADPAAAVEPAAPTAVEPAAAPAP